MSIFNEQFLPIMQKHVGQIRADGKPDFSTVDVIREYIGHFYSDETNAYESINANIGKFLQENSGALGIREKAAKQPCKDDDDNPTSTSIWEFV
jgi:hypothetical protein